MFNFRNTVSIIILTLIAAGVIFELVAPPGSTARVALEEKIATPIAAIERSLPPIPFASAARKTQLAAAATTNSFDELGHAIYLAVCPFFNGCPADPALATLTTSTRTFGDVRTAASATSLIPPKNPVAISEPQFPPQTIPQSVVTGTTREAPTQPSQPAIIQNITNPIRERVIERVAPAPTASNSFTTLLNALENKLTARIDAVSVGSANQVAAVNSQVAQSQRIDNLGSVTITNPTITGGSIVGSAITGTISNAISSAIATIDDLTSTHLVAVNATTTNLIVIGNATIGTLTGPLQATNGVISATGTIAAAYGGTGQSAYSIGDLLYADTGSSLTRLPVGSLGQVLKITDGVPAWGTDLTGSGGSSAWATTSDSLGVYTTNPNQVVLIGTAATSTTGNILEAKGNALVRGNVIAQGTATASSFTATSTANSVLPNVVSSNSTTTNSTSTNLYSSSLVASNATSTNQFASAFTATNATTTNFAATTASTTNLTAGSLAVGSLSGFLKATAGVVSTALVDLASNVTGILQVANGGTGWAAFAAGAIPYGNGSSQLATTTGGTAGQVLALLNGIPTWTATSTLTTIAGSLNLTSQVTGNLGVGNGGTGSTTLTGIVKGAGTSALQTAIAGTDYEVPLTFNAPLSRSANAISISTSGDWSGTLGGSTAAQLIATSFSTTSADAWKTTRSFFATTSSDYWLTQKTTDSLVQGSTNKYYATSLFASDLAGTTTNALPEGVTNFYFTTARASTNFANNLAATTTDALAQGAVNKYWSNTLFDIRLSATSSLPNITTLANLSLPASQLTGFGSQFYTFFHATTSDALPEGTTNLYYTPNRVAGAIAGTTTDALAEGATNLYYTDARVQSFVNASTTIPKTYSGNTFSNGNTFNGSVTIASLNGPLDARNGVVGATSSIGVIYGGTGATTASAARANLAAAASGANSDITSLSAVATLTATNASTSAISANTLAVGQTATTTISSAGAINTPSLTLGTLSGFLKATAGVISSALVDLASNVTGILQVANGGTGWAALASGAIPFGNGTGAVSTTTAGTAGQVLALLNGIPTWTATSTLATLSGILGVANGGTGSTTITGIVKGAGTGSLQTAVGGTDYEFPLTFSAPLSRSTNSITLSTVGVATGGTGSTTLSGIVKGAGTSALQTAIPGTDYQAPITASYPILFSGNALSLLFGTTTANAWSQLQTFTEGFLSQASSTIGNGTAAGGLTVAGTATTTNLTIANVTSALLKTNALGQVASAIAGTDYLTSANIFGYLFPANATSTLLSFTGGLLSTASTTIGNGNQNGGLTISGGATTTGNAYFAGNVGIGTTSPTSNLTVINSAGGGYNGPTSGTWAARVINANNASAQDGLSVSNAWAGGGSTIFEVAEGWNGSAVGYYPVLTIDGVGDLIWKNTTGTTLAEFVNSSGNIGIGTTSPGANLDIVGTSGLYGVRINAPVNSGTYYYASFNNVGGSQTGYLSSPGSDFNVNAINKLNLTSGGTVGLTMATSGNVGIGTGSTNPQGILSISTSTNLGSISLEFNGASTFGAGFNNKDTGASGQTTFNFLRNNTSVGTINTTNVATAYNTSSDRRVKENIATTTFGLDDLMRLSVRDFDFIKDPTHATTTGFIAQELQSVFPWAVTTNGDNGVVPLGATSSPWAVDYGRITPLIVKAVQDIANISGTFKSNLIAFLTTWFASATNGITDLFASIIHSHEGHFTDKLCVGAGVSESCINQTQLAALLSASPAAALANPSPPSTTSGGTSATSSGTNLQGSTTAPIIAITGNNPATIAVGSTYADLGATITAPAADLNLGLTVFVDNATSTNSSATIDTSKAGSYTITYTVTDPAGLTGSATRTVIVAPAANINTATSSAATSTAP